LLALQCEHTHLLRLGDKEWRSGWLNTQLEARNIYAMAGTPCWQWRLDETLLVGQQATDQPSPP
jgi:hypothetical protein